MRIYKLITSVHGEPDKYDPKIVIERNATGAVIEISSPAHAVSAKGRIYQNKRYRYPDPSVGKNATKPFWMTDRVLTKACGFLAHWTLNDVLFHLPELVARATAEQLEKDTGYPVPLPNVWVYDHQATR